MSIPSIKLMDPPEINDEAITEVLELLYQLTEALESQYYGQLRRYYQATEPSLPDPLTDFDDPFPDI